MTQTAFAAELGISQAQLSQIERGDRNVTANHMVTARHRFDIPLDFFSAAPITYGPNDLNYRTKKLTQAQQDRAATLFGLTEQVVREGVERRNPTGSIEAPNNESDLVRPLNEIEAYATAARELIGVRPNKVINNVTRCIERLGILVTGLNLPDLGSRIDGISTPRRTDEPFVVTFYLHKPGDRIRFSGAHELGHILLHTDTRPFSRDVRENEADSFASAFLLPREPMLDELSPGLTLAGYARIKARWGVSVQAIIRRSYDLRVVEKERYRSLMIQLSSRGWRTDEPVEVPKEAPAIPTPTFGGLRRKDVSPEGLESAGGDNVVSLLDRIPPTE